MCRLLAVASARPIDVRRHLERFAAISRASPVFQGDGWGLALRRDDGSWLIHKSLRPVWEDDTACFPPTRLLLAHARSAFDRESIALENNMPFHDGRWVFLFNGELRGVGIRETGRIGAEKVFNFIKRFEDRGPEAAIETGCSIIERRTRYVRAMNLIMCDGRAIYVRSVFNEDPAYFTMRVWRAANGAAGEGDLIICSAAFAEPAGWRAVDTRKVLAYPCW